MLWQKSRRSSNVVRDSGGGGMRFGGGRGLGIGGVVVVVIVGLLFGKIPGEVLQLLRLQLLEISLKRSDVVGVSRQLEERRQ